MPRKTKRPYTNPLPSELQISPPSKDSKGQLSYDEWTTKNARAKAIIMSTLVPGSEAWKIAEPLEYASDIWNALEEKYGPKDGTNNMWPPGTPSVESKAAVEAAKNLDAKDKATDFGQNQPPVNVVASGSRTGASASEGGSQTLCDRDASPTETEMDQGRRDKRFLWALLNGGKEKLDAVTIQTGQQLCGL
jgi:hypothetical protein